MKIRDGRIGKKKEWRRYQLTEFYTGGPQLILPHIRLISDALGEIELVISQFVTYQICVSPNAC